MSKENVSDLTRLQRSLAVVEKFEGKTFIPVEGGVKFLLPYHKLTSSDIGWMRINGTKQLHPPDGNWFKWLPKSAFGWEPSDEHV